MEKNNINAILASITDGSAQLIPAITCLPERDHVIACTDSYSQEHWSLIGSSGRINNRVNRTDTIGQINDVFSTKLITKYYPNNKVIIFNNNAELVDAIAKGKVDLGIISNSSYSLLKQNEYLGQLRILPSLLDSERKNVSIGTSINNPLLLSSLNKAMAAISEQEFEQIDKKWNAVNIHAGIPLKQLLLWGSVILVILSVIFSSFIYWNRKLTKEISRREIIQQQLVYLSNNFGGVVAQFSQFGHDITSTKCDFISSNTLDYFNIIREDIYANPALLLDYLLENSEDNDIINAIKHAQQSGYLYTTIKVQSPLGQTTWLQLTGKCVNQQNCYHWTCTFIDISQLKLQQAELDNARQLAESATAAKSQFLAMMSHEIRTPISGILSLLELMIPFTADNELYRIHKNLTQSGQNLLNIVNDVLDFSKIEAGKLSLNSTSCNLVLFLGNLVQPHVIHTEQRALKFKLWLDPNIAQRLQVDKQRLKQVLNNLLNNAAKFTETGNNMLQVDVVTTTATHQTLCFSVTDTGIGINKPDIKKLFMPFEQADISSERRFNGTGLGLSICRELVLLMGGDINVMSEHHVGSTFRFTITLPIIKPKRVRTLGKKCGLILTTSTSSEIICNYLNDWQCQTQQIQQQLNKIELAILATELQLDTILVAESWCQEQEISSNWVSRNLPGVQWIQLRSASLLSPLPSKQGWIMSINPVMPEQLWHILSTDKNALPHREVKLPSQVLAGLTREQAIAQNRLILVAEDHPINQDVIKLQLKTLGYIADIFSNGKQALAALDRQKYALLISDCHMPELDGYGLVDAIRQQEVRDPNQPRLPVIALTADAISAEEDHQALGFDDHLIKPINLPQLQDILSQWLPARNNNTSAKSISSASSLHVGLMATGSQLSPIDDSIGISVKADFTAITMINMPQLLLNYGNLDICLLLLNKFILASEQDILTLTDAIAVTNHAEVHQISHKIKGAALVIECQQLASISATMEQAAITQCDHSRLSDYLNEMISLMVQLKQQVEQI